ncbi:hypothetical protein CDCA_CDCA15G3980 [Cyanidium caldarium]|uniref:Ubiquitin-like protease family profile domain-containing protein n=1 Tax=Cyanidium caldarium TaxID=2771 RepID=A0AAV9J0S8_CYACA|nr:hypothetical protein CDCA_CDCA15G3980 [Cyanidium caldarium]
MRVPRVWARLVAWARGWRDGNGAGDEDVEQLEWPNGGTEGNFGGNGDLVGVSVGVGDASRQVRWEGVAVGRGDSGIAWALPWRGTPNGSMLRHESSERGKRWERRVPSDPPLDAFPTYRLPQHSPAPPPEAPRLDLSLVGRHPPRPPVGWHSDGLSDASKRLARLRASAALHEARLAAWREECRRKGEAIVTVEGEVEHAPSKRPPPPPPRAREPPVEVIDLLESDDDEQDVQSSRSRSGAPTPAATQPLSVRERFHLPSVVAEWEAWRDDMPLPPPAEAALQYALDARGDPNEVLTTVHGIAVTRQEIQRLLPGAWLTDNLLNVYCQHLLQARQEQHAKRNRWPYCTFFSTFFYTRLTATTDGYDYAGVRRWTRTLSGYPSQLLVFPINLGNVHWTLAVADLRTYELRYYDSMGGSGETVLAALQRWLRDEAADKQWAGTRMDDAPWRWKHPTVPQQLNGHDCGVFAAQFAELVCRDQPVYFDARKMNQVRRRMALEILCEHAFIPESG